MEQKQSCNDSASELKVDELDLSTFKNILLKCKGTNDLKCTSLIRLLLALKYYTLLIKKNCDKRFFDSFIGDIYGGINVLNDFNHLILCHSDNLQQINELLLPSKCPFNKCEFTVRHFGSSNGNESFYVSVFDSLHVWLYHCFDAGFRLKETKETINDDDIDNDQNELFDAEFDRINKAVRKTDHLTNQFERINNSNSKFNIAAEAEQGDTTFMDELIRHLTMESVHIQSIQKLIDYAEAEAFDTESFKMDLNIKGNILSIIPNKECIAEICRFIKMNGSTFSVGLRFYYWEYYKNKLELTDQEDRNIHTHSGYSVCELYVHPKYSSFKWEAMNYKHLNVTTYGKKTIKANNYLKTTQIRRIRAKIYWRLHYDISKRDKIQFGHLFALVLYCDITELSTAFSASFRKVTKYESLKSIKQRNALFYWMSRYLRELVEIFGQRSNGDTFEKNKWGHYMYDKPLDALKGYFYCGMNCKLNIDSFDMRLNGPTSTSKVFAVADKFSGPKGMIFTFDNPWNNYPYKWLRGWDCSWISEFKQEAEVFFFGGYYPIKVVSVRLMETRKNYQEYIAAIWYFDLMITGAYVKALKISKNAFGIVSNLINFVLKKEVKKKCDEYVNDTFLCFVNNKKQIILHLYHLDYYGDLKMNSLILSRLDERYFDQERRRKNEDYSNLFLPDVLRIFPNVESMTIVSTYCGYSFSFSLVALLSLISNSNLKKIIIRADKSIDGDVWTKELWNSEKESLSGIYAAKSFNISAKEDEIGFSLIINKLDVNKHASLNTDQRKIKGNVDVTCASVLSASANEFVPDFVGRAASLNLNMRQPSIQPHLAHAQSYPMVSTGYSGTMIQFAPMQVMQPWQYNGLQNPQWIFQQNLLQPKPQNEQTNHKTQNDIGAHFSGTLL